VIGEERGMAEESSGAKKLHVDEDWKSQVETERAAAEKPKPREESDRARPIQWPEPSLALLVTTLATQAMSAFGFAAHPVTGKSEVDLPQAKHFIDTLDMLQQKTRGNQTPEESEMFESVLHELRMTFIAVSERQP
jgi:hypothetical protein